MKSVEQKISERQDELKARGVTAEQITEAVKNCTNLEQRLNVLEGFNENPFTRHNRVQRKNGSAIRESGNTGKDEQIHSYMKRTGASFREASIVLTGVDPGANAKFSKEFVESLAEKWRNSGAMLSESEITTLSERGIQP